MPASNRIQRLVNELSAAGYRGANIERLREHLGGASATPNGLRAELLSEMAAALGRSEEHLLVALALLDACAARLAAASPENHDALLDAFNAQRSEALRRRWELEVHREAIGIRHSQAIAEAYPIPPPAYAYVQGEGDAATSGARRRCI